jgi:hypothetical protein
VSKSNLILESSLQVFFYDLLQDFNRKSTRPLPNETIFYSSLVMDQFGNSEKYFEEVDGKLREKILGIKLLESGQMPKEKMKATLKDVAETSLLVCGYFSDSLNRKMTNVNYYQDLGVIAYSRLNSLEPKAYNIDSFYSKVSKSFLDITILMNLASKNDLSDPSMPWLISKNLVKAS